MCLEVLSSSSASILLERLLIPESTGLLLGDVTITEGGACIQGGLGADGAAASSCVFKIWKLSASSPSCSAALT